MKENIMLNSIPYSEDIFSQVGHTWHTFWNHIQTQLRQRGYKKNTLILYRQILRNLAKHSQTTPSQITYKIIMKYIYHLTDNHVSASWLAMNISVLRTCFDKCCGTTLLETRIGPKRPRQLPTILAQEEIQKMMTVVDNPRDALILALLYGCGLKPGEACALRWQDFDLITNGVTISGERQRTIVIPQAIIKLIALGQRRCDPTDYIFAGRNKNAHLSVRSIDRIVRTTAIMAGLIKPITAMTLRHTYAVHQLQAGVNIREVQESLGLSSLETMIRYQRCIPIEITSPFDQLPSSQIPDIPIEDLELPFKHENPIRYFYKWMKMKLHHGFCILRGSG